MSACKLLALNLNKIENRGFTYLASSAMLQKGQGDKFHVNLLFLVLAEILEHLGETTYFQGFRVCHKICTLRG